MRMLLPTVFVVIAIQILLFRDVQAQLDSSKLSFEIAGGAGLNSRSFNFQYGGSLYFHVIESLHVAAGGYFRGADNPNDFYDGEGGYEINDYLHFFSIPVQVLYEFGLI